MELKDDHILITDETILSFYKENSNLNFVTMNHIFIDILKSLSSNLSNTINSTMNSKILSMVIDTHSNLNTIKSDIIIKLHETKKEYVEDIKTILQNNSLTNNEKINALIEKNNDSLLTKTTLIVNDVIPKSQDKNYMQIENCIKGFCSSITQDTTKLLELTNKDDHHIDAVIKDIETQFSKSQDKNYMQIENCIKGFCSSITQDTTKLLELTHKDDHHIDAVIKDIEIQFSKMISTIQQPIFSFIQSSEERTNTGIQNVRDNLITQQLDSNKLTTELHEFLQKYTNNSSVKGNVSETELFFLLQSIMPSDEIIKVSSDTATCDIKVNRMDINKPSILFENKDYTRSSSKDEIIKFERDLQIQKMHGIFISQKSPVALKNNFQIDIINGLIHIYIHYADYDPHKIKMAIDVIDSLDLKLKFLEKSKEDEYSIDKEDMDDILEEYRIFIVQKTQMIETIKSVTKQLIDKMEDIQLPKLKKLFMNLGNIENDNDFKCTFCISWTGKNKGSVSAHVRTCKLNPKNKKIITNTSEQLIDLQLNPVCIEIVNEPKTVEKNHKVKKLQGKK
jgi:hypothetical protein